MKQSNHYRLLQLRAILYDETDEENELNINEIKDKLMVLLNVDKLDVRTIRNDIQALQTIGFDIVENRKQHGKVYYSHQNRLFETYQIRLLADAILSARSIPPNEKEALIGKSEEHTSELQSR